MEIEVHPLRLYDESCKCEREGIIAECRSLRPESSAGLR